MLMNAENLLKQADDLFEQRRFAEARDIYRAVALSTLPNEYALNNLQIAEEQERFSFSRTLVEKHPNSTLVWRYQIETLMKVGLHWYDHAIRYCSSVLEWNNLDPDDKLGFRRLRLLAVLRGGTWQKQDAVLSPVEDFLAIWGVGERKVWGTYLRASLIGEIVSLRGTRHLPMLEVLADQENLPDEVKQLFRLKITELRLFASAGPKYK